MKNVKRWWAAWVVALAVYHVLVFVLPFERTPVFFVSYLFTLAALGAQICVFRTAFTKGAGVRSKFYGWPIARVGVLYLAAQLALGLVFMALGTVVPVWLPVILFALMLGAAMIGFLSADAIRDEIHRQDAKLQKDVACMRALQSKVGSLLGQIQDPALLEKIRAFSEALRYSDPVSSEATRDMERELRACVENLEAALADGDGDCAAELCRKAQALLAERNRQCKLNKSGASGV